MAQLEPVRFYPFSRTWEGTPGRGVRTSYHLLDRVKATAGQQP